MATHIQERTVFIVLATLMAFLFLNFNQELGTIFSILLILDYIMFYSDNFVSYPFEKTSDNRMQAVLYSIIGYGVFIGLASVLAGVANFAGSVLETLSTSVPVLSQSQSIAILAWGVLIPIIETRFFFGRLFEFIGDKWNAPMGRAGLTSIRTWMTIVFVSGLFALFHLTAKASQGDIGFLTTFIFGAVSCAMVVYFQETKQATGMHIFSNTIAVLTKYGVI